MKIYLDLFEQAVNKYAELVGEETARSRAEQAGLSFDDEGRVVGFTTDPKVVLLRFIRSITENANVATLEACLPLINTLLKQFDSEELTPHAPTSEPS